MLNKELEDGSRVEAMHDIYSPWNNELILKKGNTGRVSFSGTGKNIDVYLVGTYRRVYYTDSKWGAFDTTGMLKVVKPNSIAQLKYEECEVKIKELNKIMCELKKEL